VAKTRGKARDARHGQKAREHLIGLGEHALAYITELVHRRPKVWIRDVDQLHDLLERHERDNLAAPPGHVAGSQQVVKVSEFITQKFPEPTYYGWFARAKPCSMLYGSASSRLRSRPANCAGSRTHTASSPVRPPQSMLNSRDIHVLKKLRSRAPVTHVRVGAQVARMAPTAISLVRWS
jgi:hypothetical protein